MAAGGTIAQRITDLIGAVYSTEANYEGDLINAAINETGAESMQDIGKVMGVLKSSLAGSADMGLVSKIVKDQLS